MPYVFALLFFLALVFTLTVWYIDSHSKQKKLTEKERKLLQKEYEIKHLEDAVINDYDDQPWDELEQYEQYEQKEM